jgi:hypothetical protein
MCANPREIDYTLDAMFFEILFATNTTDSIFKPDVYCRGFRLT